MGSATADAMGEAALDRRRTLPHIHPLTLPNARNRDHPIPDQATPRKAFFLVPRGGTGTDENGVTVPQAPLTSASNRNACAPA